MRFARGRKYPSFLLGQQELQQGDNWNPTNKGGIA
jgi:hypothetical protein